MLTRFLLVGCLSSAPINPLGRAPADQIGIAAGSLEQKTTVFQHSLQHRQNTLETDWNWSLLEGWLLTPDVQYLRNPLFTLSRNSTWILSLRTTLSF